MSYIPCMYCMYYLSIPFGHAVLTFSTDKAIACTHLRDSREVSIILRAYRVVNIILRDYRVVNIILRDYRGRRPYVLHVT
jgi:hypothetical protein